MLNFDYLKPASLAEALALRQAGARALFVAGGTDVIPLIKKKVISPDVLISLRGISELKGLYEASEQVVVGSGVTLRELEKSPLVGRFFPALRDAVIDMASVQIRNVATLGGNIVNASPGADSAAPLLIYAAEVAIVRADGRERRLPLDDFFLGPKRVALEEDELVRALVLPKPRPGCGSAYAKFMKRKAMDLANVGVGVSLCLDDGGVCRGARIGLATVAPTPLRARRVEEFLRGRVPDDDVLREAGLLAAGEISPIDDLRGRAWHKTEVVKSYLPRVAKIARQRALSD